VFLRNLVEKKGPIFRPWEVGGVITVNPLFRTFWTPTHKGGSGLRDRRNGRMKKVFFFSICHGSFDGKTSLAKQVRWGPSRKFSNKENYCTKGGSRSRGLTLYLYQENIRGVGTAHRLLLTYIKRMPGECRENEALPGRRTDKVYPPEKGDERGGFKRNANAG